MCGITGLVSVGANAAQIDRAIVDSMTDAMIHRGPDGRGIWMSSDRKAALGHRRLSIIDLSPSGAQPMSNEDGRIWVTFNGEIYNYQALRRELEQRGHKFTSKSDTEVLVHLYEEHGDAMVGRLDGDFAFGLWDSHRHRLLMARDPAGVKPLYYAWAGKQFLFASELKALLKHPGLPRTIDKEALHHYLTYLAVPAPFAMIKGVRKLGAGEILTLDYEGNMNLQRYWEPLPGKVQVDLSAMDEQLEDLLTKSVRKRLISDVPVGLMFSGGVDSTLNALLFNEITYPERVHTYNIWMREPRYFDESHIAQQVAQCVGTNHHEMQLTSNLLLDGLIRGNYLAFFQDEPLADPAGLSLYFVTKLARETGRVVLQAGEGADEIFCGYDGFRNWLRREDEYWRRLCYLPKAAGSLGYALTRHIERPFVKKIADVFRRRSLGQEFFMSEAVGYYEHEKLPILSHDYKSAVNGVDSFTLVAPLYGRIRKERPGANFLEIMTYIELSLRLPELLLMRADKFAMANSVEMRVPFLDRDLVDFALSVPQSFKLRNGVSKEPLKRLAARKLKSKLDAPVPPTLGGSCESVFYRPKTGFGAAIEDWFDTELRGPLLEIVEAEKFELAEFFDIHAIKQLIQQGVATANRSYQLWALFCFIFWKRAYSL